MGHGIFEVAKKFGYSHSTISRVYHEYQESDDLQDVAWSDESRLQLNPADRRVRVWIQPHEFMEWIHETYMATGDCSSWWRLCDGIEREQLA
ncbi:hypothetical protein TNCV_4494651 [Trichonephila clavipes]|nr:hypothetical protein TNCV_4494651 [Trichonephila clavipes]